MIPFAKPGASAPYHVMAAEAARAALQDAGVDYSEIEQAYAGFVFTGRPAPFDDFDAVTDVQRIYGGANEIMKEIIARSL
jgi:alkylation response protein AidB-like acyl-CoA dehydrogenase